MFLEKMDLGKTERPTRARLAHAGDTSLLLDDAVEPSEQSIGPSISFVSPKAPQSPGFVTRCAT